MAQNQNEDNSLDFLYIAGILLFIYIMVQIWFGDDIAFIYVKIRWLWLKCITFFWEKESYMSALRMIETRHIKEITGTQLVQLSNDLRVYMFLFWGTLVGFMGYKTIKNNPAQKFNRKLDRKELSHEMTKDFPWILPALQQDLIKESITDGPWSMGIPPLKFAKKYGLLNGKNIDEEKAEKLFAVQLGSLWNGYNRLNPEMKALFACFAAQVCRDKDAADEALRELVISISSNKPVWTKSDALLKKYGDDPRVTKICSKHAYQYTVMIALFEAGKKIGIFPPNHFLWCRPRKRVLWYALNCVMRRRYFAEVSGIYAHFLAEKVANHKLEIPYVKKAVLALNVALADILFDENEDDV